MGSEGARTFVVGGGGIALILLIAAVWATSMSVPAQLALTGLLVLIAVGIVAAVLPRGAGSPAPVDEDAEQRERMRGRVP